MAAVHAGLALAGWQVVQRPTPVFHEPLRVSLVELPRIAVPAPELPRPLVVRWQSQPIQPPEVVTLRSPDPEPRPNVQPAPEPVVPVRPAPAEQPRIVVAPPPPPPPPALTAPRQLPASAVAYLVPPPIEVPLASRRLGEQGTVWLRVLVGADGSPRQVTVQRSSGHRRLDEQALWAMRQARFRPQVEQGVAVEWIVIAPLQYEIA